MVSPLMMATTGSALGLAAAVVVATDGAVAAVCCCAASGIATAASDKRIIRFIRFPPDGYQTPRCPTGLREESIPGEELYDLWNVIMDRAAVFHVNNNLRFPQ